jgi:hypothetical protein
MNMSTGAMVRFGWETFKKRPWFFIGMQIAIGLIGAVLGGASNIPELAFKGTAYAYVGVVIGVLVSWAAQAIVGLGTMNFYFKAHDNIEHTKFEDFFKFDHFWKYVGVNILYGLIVVAGFILLIVPGIIWSYKYFLAPYLVVDKGMYPIEALKESDRLTNGNKWRMFVLSMATTAIVFLGLAALFVGLFVAIPVVTLAFVHLYRVSVHNMEAGIAHPPLSKRENNWKVASIVATILLIPLMIAAFIAFVALVPPEDIANQPTAEELQAQIDTLNAQIDQLQAGGVEPVPTFSPNGPGTQ